MLRSVLLLAFVVVGCGKDAATSCKDMCAKASYTSSRVETATNEINCYCSGGSTTDLTPQQCTDMCKEIGKASGTVFKSAGLSTDSCQCQ